MKKRGNRVLAGLLAVLVVLGAGSDDGSAVRDTEE